MLLLVPSPASFGLHQKGWGFLYGRMQGRSPTCGAAKALFLQRFVRSPGWGNDGSFSAVKQMWELPCDGGDCVCKHLDSRARDHLRVDTVPYVEATAPRGPEIRNSRLRQWLGGVPGHHVSAAGRLDRSQHLGDHARQRAGGFVEKAVSESGSFLHVGRTARVASSAASRILATCSSSM
jgi:hypothetical protein